MKFLNFKTTILLLLGLVTVYIWSTNHNDIENVDLSGYAEMKALVTNKIWGRSTRYGMQQHRYSLQILQQDGDSKLRGNVRLGGDFNINDTITILYHTTDMDKPILLPEQSL